MQELLLGIWEADRKTVLFVTHDIDEAIFMANRVVVMSARPGRIKAEVEVDLPHPRHYTVKTTPEFAAQGAAHRGDPRGVHQGRTRLTFRCEMRRGSEPSHMQCECDRNHHQRQSSKKAA